jgi:HSP20 family protein
MANIVRYDPFEELTRLQRDMTRLFDESVRTPVRGASENGGASTRSWAPSVDVRENQNEVVVQAELPGIRQEDIDIEVTGDTLTIRGERKFEQTDKKDNYVRIERAYGSFQRSFAIGVPIQNDKVSATYKDGLLTIQLPKSEAIKPKKVQVQVQGDSGNTVNTTVSNSEQTRV